MASHSSATALRESPHVTKSTRTNAIINALTRRAQAVLNDETIDPETRAVIRYGLETNDSWLAKLVRRADAGETTIEAHGFLQTSDTDEHEASEKKIAALVEMICRAGDEPETKTAALLVLMSTLENSSHPKALANSAKHFAFTRCGELNLNGMVDAQIAVVEGELFAGT